MPFLRDRDLAYKFLGGDRWKRLGSALAKESRREVAPLIPTVRAVSALLVALTPPALAIVAAQMGSPAGFPVTLAFGICTVGAILLRSRFGIAYVGTDDWRSSISITHTAFAAGCVPAVLVVLLRPELLAERYDVISGTGAGGALITSPLVTFFYTMFIAAWVAVTEEFLFRGLLVSVVRRWSVLQNWRLRDHAAILCSALIFGIGHYGTWGIAPAIALAGIGAGLAAGYIANGERLMPVILYHFAFDLLSLTLPLLL